jgi:hypothetical protein
MRLEGTGIRLELPRGWEGRVRARGPEPEEGSGSSSAVRTAAADRTGPAPVVVTAANFALPQTLGDFGGGAVEVMRSQDLFLTLFEYGPESVGTPLFARQGMPRRLRPADLDPWTLRTPLPGMSGAQLFFTEAGRPFCLYVAVGSHLRRVRTLPVMNQILQTVEVDPA